MPPKITQAFSHIFQHLSSKHKCFCFSACSWLPLLFWVLKNPSISPWVRRRLLTARLFNSELTAGIIKTCQKLIFSTELNESSSLSAGDYISLPIHNNLNPSSANYFNRNLPNHLHQWLRVLLFHTLQFGLLFFFPTHLLNVQNTQSHTLELIWTDLIPLGSTDFNRATLT